MTESTQVPCLKYQILNPLPGKVEESWSVFIDGHCELAVMAALDPVKRCRAGVFVTPPDAQAAEEAAILVELLSSLNFDGIPYPRGVQWSVTAYSGGVTRSYNLSVMEQTPLHTWLEKALEQGKAWKTKAEASPYCAVRMSAELRENQQYTRLTVAYEAAGSLAIQFLLSPASLAIISEQEGTRREIWRSKERLHMGLIDEEGMLADGINIPARLTPGCLAFLPLRLDDLGKDLDRQSLRLLCEGFIAPTWPNLPPPDFPRTPVWLECSIA